jgi:mannosyltransferase OCH1-like enzyme
MIPKLIHYFWFGKDQPKKEIKQCIESWKNILPDFKIVKWDLNNFNIDCKYAKYTERYKKWAFLTDYARFKVLYEFGGVYLDTDMLILKRFDGFLKYDSFWSLAPHGNVEPVIIGTIPGNKIVLECLEKYKHMIPEKMEDLIELPSVISQIFFSQGFESNSREIKIIKNNVLFPPEYFCPIPFELADSKDKMKFVTRNTISIHLWNSAWFDDFRFFWSGRRKSGWNAVLKTLIKNPFQSNSYYRSILYHLFNKVK